MTITDVKIRKLIDNGTPLKAIVSITIGGELAVHDLKVVEKQDGSLFVAMPSARDNQGEFRDVCHPINQDTRRKFTSVILPIYYITLRKMEANKCEK